MPRRQRIGHRALSVVAITCCTLLTTAAAICALNPVKRDGDCAIIQPTGAAANGQAQARITLTGGDDDEGGDADFFLAKSIRIKILRQKQSSSLPVSVVAKPGKRVKKALKMPAMTTRSAVRAAARAATTKKVLGTTAKTTIKRPVTTSVLRPTTARPSGSSGGDASNTSVTTVATVTAATAAAVTSVTANSPIRNSSEALTTAAQINDSVFSTSQTAINASAENLVLTFTTERTGNGSTAMPNRFAEASVSQDDLYSVQESSTLSTATTGGPRVSEGTTLSTASVFNGSRDALTLVTSGQPDPAASIDQADISNVKNLTSTAVSTAGAAKSLQTSASGSINDMSENVNSILPSTPVKASTAVEAVDRSTPSLSSSLSTASYGAVAFTSDASTSPSHDLATPLRTSSGDRQLTMSNSASAAATTVLTVTTPPSINQSSWRAVTGGVASTSGLGADGSHSPAVFGSSSVATIRPSSVGSSLSPAVTTDRSVANGTISDRWPEWHSVSSYNGSLVERRGAGSDVRPALWLTSLLFGMAFCLSHR